MDDRNKSALGVGTAGAILGGAVGGPYGAAIGGTLGALFGSHEKKHNSILRETYYGLIEATDAEPRFHVAHISPRGTERGGTRGVVSGVAGAPDLVMLAPGLPYPNLILEVETIQGIRNDESHAIDQLNDFQTEGFKRVLVAPEDDLNVIYEWCDHHEQRGEIRQEVQLSSPDRISGVL